MFAPISSPAVLLGSAAANETMAEPGNSILRIVPDGPPQARDTSADGAAGAAPDVVFIVDAEGTILYVNRSLPHAHQDDVLGTSVYDYILPEHHVAARAGVQRVFATGLPGGFEILGMAGADSEAWYDCRVVPTMRGGRVVSGTIIARDVTIRKRVEENLRKELDVAKRDLGLLRGELDAAREARGLTADMARAQARVALFRQVLDQAGEAIFIVDPATGQVIDANETACRWVSHRHEDLITQKEADLRLQFPLRVPEHYGDHVTETRDTRRPQIFRGEHRRTNGSSFPVEVAITRHVIDGRDLVLAVARDSKDRLKVEQALRETEDKYRALFELSRDAIYLSHRDGTIAEVNDSAVELFGFSREEFERFPARNLYVNTEDIRGFQREVGRNGYVRDMEVGFVRQDGETFRAFLTATLRHAGDGTALGYQCVIRPLTNRPPSPRPPSRRAMEEAERIGHGTVLLVEPNLADRAEVQQVLELAGMRVLIGESLSEALVIVRARGEEIGVAVLAGTAQDIIHDPAFGEIRRIAPNTRVVLLGTHDDDEREVVEHLSAANLAGIVRKPFHPLGLIQRVREAFDLSRQTARPVPRTSRAMEVPPDA